MNTHETESKKCKCELCEGKYIQVDPVGCGCTECIIGEYRPARDEYDYKVHNAPAEEKTQEGLKDKIENDFEELFEINNNQSVNCKKHKALITGFEVKEFARYEVREALKKVREDSLEALAELEHEQWIYWAKNILETETISPQRKERWQKLFCGYNQLNENAKEQDRVWARKVLQILTNFNPKE